VFLIIMMLDRLMTSNIRAWKGSLIKPLKFKQVELVSAQKIVQGLVFLTKVFRTIILLLAFYIYLIIVFSFFGFTRNWSSLLLAYIIRPLYSLGMSFITYLPNFFYILVVGVITWYLIKLLRVIFVEIDKGTITLPGFYPDWALPTYQIAKIFMILFAAIILFPYIPGSSSPGFRGISIFFGLLISLGSTSAIANMISGIVITYMRPFRLGDRVKIADTIGDIVEKTILVTRVKTVKNVIITIPNAIILGSHIINYSSSARESGLILNTSVTIGYDVPWRKVHELLLAAARDTEFTLTEPEPFVLQKSLDDFSVPYELNVATDHPERMERIYSELHTKIQDRFNEAGIEIMSPHYTALREGNKIAIPEEYIPRGYQQPGFRFIPRTPTEKHESDKT